jgi:hypothetical protein
MDLHISLNDPDRLLLSDSRHIHLGALPLVDTAILQIVQPSELNAVSPRFIPADNFASREFIVEILPPYTAPTQGKFTLTYEGETTTELDLKNDGDAAIISALNKLSTVSAAGGVERKTNSAHFWFNWKEKGTRSPITVTLTGTEFPATATYNIAVPGSETTREIATFDFTNSPLFTIDADDWTLEDDAPTALITEDQAPASGNDWVSIQTLTISEPETAGGILSITVDGAQSDYFDIAEASYRPKILEAAILSTGEFTAGESVSVIRTKTAENKSYSWQIYCHLAADSSASPTLTVSTDTLVKTERLEAPFEYSGSDLETHFQTLRQTGMGKGSFYLRIREKLTADNSPVLADFLIPSR